MICQKQIPHEHETRMANQGIVIAGLDFRREAQVLLDPIKERFHIPMFTALTNDVFIG